MLAFACRRANKPRNEALAYYNMGVLLDNDKELEKANACYEQYLQASRAVGDAKGEQLALNSMAINMFKLGRYEEAIDLSNQHLQIADVAGKFVAHCNLGLAYAAMDELEQSSLNHRQALRYAIVMSSVVGESLACGNLGNVAERKGDMRTSKACMERHLKLSSALKDFKAQLDANLLLGKMANEEGQYEEASSYFESAKKIAQELGDSRAELVCKCKIGMARGNAKFEVRVWDRGEEWEKEGGLLRA
uniref:MalT-like TPR region domain-containing protein n=1 Tax=Hanusia phi TaxID=3032 RepID=A0A7S0ERI5_9CRYP|mmetsp:Transcript_29174/g.66116  ORF Transcript_29174/g.66116 Transcript_29174/m.66116 type:complete len:248 (+) Transcript_29174:114-857(+)